ncbi:hypothetical protein HY989_02720 [Candidatus Micrarchaeota archaeon]|nr:hypothetical protein [Candidatus Micrarchaeota archaeon]
MRMIVAIFLISCLFIAGCTALPEKTQASISITPSPTKMPLSPNDELYSDQLDGSIEELDLVG